MSVTKVYSNVLFCCTGPIITCILQSFKTSMQNNNNPAMKRICGISIFLSRLLLIPAKNICYKGKLLHSVVHVICMLAYYKLMQLQISHNVGDLCGISRKISCHKKIDEKAYTLKMPFIYSESSTAIIISFLERDRERDSVVYVLTKDMCFWTYDYFICEFA